MPFMKNDAKVLPFYNFIKFFLNRKNFLIQLEIGDAVSHFTAEDSLSTRYTLPKVSLRYKQGDA